METVSEHAGRIETSDDVHYQIKVDGSDRYITLPELDLLASRLLISLASKVDRATPPEVKAQVFEEKQKKRIADREKQVADGVYSCRENHLKKGKGYSYNDCVRRTCSEGFVSIPRQSRGL